METKLHNVYDSTDEDQGENDSLSRGDSELLKKYNVHDDAEAQLTKKRASASAAEYSIPSSTKYLYLIIYFTLNLSLTIYNKYVLGKVCQWKKRSSSLFPADSICPV